MARKIQAPPEPSKPLAVRFRVGLREWLTSEAAERGTSVNALVNDIVTKHMHWRAGMARRKGSA